MRCNQSNFYSAKSKKVVSFRITRGNVHDAKKFCPLVRESSKTYNIDKVYADKAQDNRRNFNLLELFRALIAD
ncbi:MAG: transposase [Candidatus Nitrosopolaris sp.]